MQEQGWAVPQPVTRSLRLLLLICAGALIVIVVTLIGTVQDAQTVHITAPVVVEPRCGMSEAQFITLPVSLQYQLDRQFVAAAENNP